MKKQTGVWVDAQVWDAYRELCDREKLGLAEPIEEYVRFVLKVGSPLTVLTMMRSLSEAKSGGLEDYARVLLNWHRNGQYWVRITDENEVTVEHLLLNALKELPDEQLRKEIRESLMWEPRKKRAKTNEQNAVEEPVELEASFSPELQVPSTVERIDRIKKEVASREISPEQARRMLDKIHEIREQLRSGEKGRRKK
jgi:hypothetical protein